MTTEEGQRPHREEDGAGSLINAGLSPRRTLSEPCVKQKKADGEFTKTKFFCCLNLTTSV